MSQLRIGSRPAQSEKTVSINLPVPDFGGIFVSDTAERTLTQPEFWSHILCLTDAVIDVAGSNIANAAAGANTATAVAIKAGTPLPGVFNRFKLASGTVVAYKGNA